MPTPTLPKADIDVHPAPERGAGAVTLKIKNGIPPTPRNPKGRNLVIRVDEEQAAALVWAIIDAAKLSREGVG